MGNSPRIIYECPSIENTIPLTLYRAQAPARYSHADGDKLILHAGNGHCQVQFPGPGSYKVHEEVLRAGPEVAVFVLDTSLVLWFKNGNGQFGNHSPQRAESAAPGFGVELPYPSIALHALRESAPDRPVLYLQVMSCDLFQNLDVSEYAKTVELVLTVGNPVNIAAESAHPLLSHDSPHRLYDALATCSALHYDSDPNSETASDDLFSPSHEWITADSATDGNLNLEQAALPAGWINSGDADDLGEDGAEIEGDAGMNVALGYVTVAGVVRRRASVSEEAQKQRRLG